MERGYDLVRDTLVSWFEALLRHLPNFVVAFVVLVIAYFGARIVRASVMKVLARTSLPPPVARIFGALSYISVISAGVFIALSVLQLDKTVTSILAGAGVVGLALSFAFQDLASNFIAGLLITLQRPLRIGDLVKTNDYLGHVESIGLRSVTVRDLDGQHVIIPSKDIFQHALTNFSLDGKRRVQLEVGVTYAADLQAVEDVVKTTISELGVAMEDKPITVDWFGFGDSSINFKLRFWIESSEQSDYNRSLAEALKAVKRAFDANDITIPFPIRTIDFGIEGGQRATEVARETIQLLRADTTTTRAG